MSTNNSIGKIFKYSIYFYLESIELSKYFYLPIYDKYYHGVFENLTKVTYMEIGKGSYYRDPITISRTLSLIFSLRDSTGCLKDSTICFHEISMKKTSTLTLVCCEEEWMEVRGKSNLLRKGHGYFLRQCKN